MRPQHASERTGLAVGASVATVAAGAAALYYLLRGPVLNAVTTVKTSLANSRGEGPKRYRELMVEAARKANIPPSILGGIISAESSWSNRIRTAAHRENSATCGTTCLTARPDSKGECAVGMAQVKPSTARGVGVRGDLCDPATGMLAGAEYLAHLLRRYRRKFPDMTDEELWPIVTRAYHAGPGNVDKWMANGTFDSPAIPGTFRSRDQAYGKIVMAQREKFREQGLAGPVSTRVSLFGYRTNA